MICYVKYRLLIMLKKCMQNHYSGASRPFFLQVPEPTFEVDPNTTHKSSVWWIWIIYSGSGSSFEFSEFRIQAKVPDPAYIN